MTPEEFDKLKCGDTVIGGNQSQFVIILRMMYKDRLLYVVEHQGFEKNFAVITNPLNFKKLKNRISLGGCHESKD